MLKKYSIHPLCAEILEDLTQLLLMHSFDLTRLVYSEDIRLFDDPKSLFVGLAVVQCLQVLSDRYCSSFRNLYVVNSKIQLRSFTLIVV